MELNAMVDTTNSEIIRLWKIGQGHKMIIHCLDEFKKESVLTKLLGLVEQIDTLNPCPAE